MEVLGLHTPVLVEIDGKKRVELHEVSPNPDRKALLVVKLGNKTRVLMRPGVPRYGHGLYVATDGDAYYRASLARNNHVLYVPHYRCAICPALKEAIDAAIAEWINKDMENS